MNDTLNSEIQDYQIKAGEIRQIDLQGNFIQLLESDQPRVTVVIQGRSLKIYAGTAIPTPGGVQISGFQVDNSASESVLNITLHVGNVIILDSRPPKDAPTYPDATIYDGGTGNEAKIGGTPVLIPATESGNRRKHFFVANGDTSSKLLFLCDKKKKQMFPIYTGNPPTVIASDGDFYLQGRSSQNDAGAQLDRVYYSALYYAR